MTAKLNRKINTALAGLMIGAAALLSLSSAFAEDNGAEHFSCYNSNDKILCYAPGTLVPAQTNASAAAVPASNATPTPVAAPPSISESTPKPVAPESTLHHVSTTPPESQPLDITKMSVSSDIFGWAGPISIDLKYDPDLSYILGLSYIQMLGNAGVNIRVAGGENELRGNITLGYGLTPKQQIKITYEYLTQNLPFDFASGQINQWVSQSAYGAAYRYLINRSIFRALGADVSYVKAGSKELAGVVYYKDDEAYYNWRRIAGGTEKTASATVEFLPFKNTLVKVGAGYSDIAYDMQYGNSEKNSTIAYEANVEHILTPKTKISSSIKHTAGSTEHGLKISQILPKKLEATLSGQYSAGEMGLGDNANVMLGISYPAPQQYSVAEMTALDSLKNWIRTPVVTKQRVLAIKEEKSEKYNISAEVIANQAVETGGSINPVNTKDYFNFNSSLYSSVQYTVHAYQYDSQSGTFDNTTDYAGALKLAVKSNSDYDATVYSQAPVPSGMNAQYQVNIIASGTQTGLKAPITATGVFGLTVYTNSTPAPKWKTSSVLVGAIEFNKVVSNPTAVSATGENPANGIYLNKYLDGDYKNLNFTWNGGNPPNWQIKNNGNDWYLSRALRKSDGTISAEDVGEQVKLNLNATDGNSSAAPGQLQITVETGAPSSAKLLTGEKSLPVAGYHQVNYQSGSLYQSDNSNASVIYSATQLPDGSEAAIYKDQLSNYYLTRDAGLGLIAGEGVNGAGVIQTPSSQDYVKGEAGTYALDIKVKSKAFGGTVLQPVTLSLTVSPNQVPEWAKLTGTIPMDYILDSNAVEGQGIALEDLLDQNTVTADTTFTFSGTSTYWRIKQGADGKHYLLRSPNASGKQVSVQSQPVTVVAANGTAAAAPQTLNIEVKPAAVGTVTVSWNYLSPSLPTAQVNQTYPTVAPLFTPGDNVNPNKLRTDVRINGVGYYILDDQLSNFELDKQANLPTWLGINNGSDGNGALVDNGGVKTAGDNYTVGVQVQSLASLNSLTTKSPKPLPVGAGIPAWKTDIGNLVITMDAISNTGQGGISLSNLLSDQPAGTTFQWRNNQKPTYWKLDNSGTYLMRDVDSQNQVSATFDTTQPVIIDACSAGGCSTQDLTSYIKLNPAVSPVSLLWTDKALPIAVKDASYNSGNPITPLYNSSNPKDANMYLYTSVKINGNDYTIVNDRLTGLTLLDAPTWLSINDNNQGTLSGVSGKTPSDVGDETFKVSANSLAAPSIQSAEEPITVVDNIPPVWKFNGPSAPFTVGIPFDQIAQPQGGSQEIILNNYLTNTPAGLNFSFDTKPGVLTKGNFQIVQDGNNFYLRRKTNDQNQLDAGDINQANNPIIGIVAFYAGSTSTSPLSIGYFNFLVTSTAITGNISYVSPSSCNISSETAAQIYQRQPWGSDPIATQNLTACLNGIQTFDKVNGTTLEVINNPIAMRDTTPNWIQVLGGNLAIYNPPVVNATTSATFEGASPASNHVFSSLDRPWLVTSLSKILITSTTTNASILPSYVSPTLVTYLSLSTGTYSYTGSDFDNNSNVSSIAFCPTGTLPPESWNPNNPNQYGCVSSRDINFNVSAAAGGSEVVPMIVTFKSGSAPAINNQSIWINKE